MPSSYATCLLLLGICIAVAVGWPGIIFAGLGALWELIVTTYNGPGTPPIE